MTPKFKVSSNLAKFLKEISSKELLKSAYTYCSSSNCSKSPQSCNETFYFLSLFNIGGYASVALLMSAMFYPAGFSPNMVLHLVLTPICPAKPCTMSRNGRKSYIH